MLKYCFTLLAYLYCCCIFAQQPYAISINNKDGLPSNTVYNILQDKKGFIWIASDEGLCRYDGSQFVSFRNKGQTSISGSNIIEDKYGRIWYQNFDGFCFYVENDSLFSLNQNKPYGYFPMGVTQNNVFIIQERGIDVYDLKTLAFINTIEISFDLLNHTTSNQRSFFLIDRNRLYCIDSTLSVKKFSLTLDPKEVVRQIYATSDTIQIVSKLNEGKNIYEWSEKGGIKHLTISKPRFIQGYAKFDNEHWILTSQGICIASEGSEKQLFNNSNISCVIKDRQQNYWVGTTDNGVLLIPNIDNQFTALAPYTPSVFLKNETGFDVFTKKDEWLSVNRELSKIELVKKNKANTNVYYAYRDPVNKNLFISSYGTTFYPSSNPNKDVFDNSATKDIVRLDEKYYAFASSGNCGIMVASNLAQPSIWDKSFAQFYEINHSAYVLRGVRGKSVAYDSAQQTIYYATNIGLYKQNIKGVSEILLKGERVYCKKIIACSNGILVNTPQGLVYKIVADTLAEIINDRTTINLSEINKIKYTGDYICLISDQKVLFLSTTNSLAVIGFLPLKMLATEITDITTIGNYAYVLTQTGIIRTIIQSSSAPFVSSNFAVNKVLVNGVPQSLMQSFSLPHNQNNITINFSILDYINPNQSTIYISHNDESWITLAPQARSVDFASLSPGTYHIRFKINGEIISNASIHFTIEKPYWLTWWFITLIGLVSIGILYTYYRWQIGLLVKKNKLENEKLNLQNELNNSMLTSIRSQMNPHFFYNALNTIQSYIFSNDKKNASNYLAMFSKLTRNILEMSEKQLVKLSEEMSSLQLYLDLEKMRFEEQLNYKIYIASTIDADLIKIPPMLIQPYVENAIKHGLLHLKGTRTLSIQFEVNTPSYLTVTIDDNGIGRKRSNELNKIKNEKHASFSSQANAKRLELLNKGRKQSVGIRFIDKTDENDLPTGTKVMIDIPYN